MALRFELDPEPTPALQDAIAGLWTDVTNAGGAVGLVPPVDRETVVPQLPRLLSGYTGDGLDHLLVGYEGDRLAALVVICDRRFVLQNHVKLLRGVMVDPKDQGKGYGVELMREAERVARTLGGVEMLHLTCRGGLGLERFYGKCGYREVGRVVRALRVAADDYRDEVHLQLIL